MDLRLPDVAGVTWAVFVRSTASLEPGGRDRRARSTDPAQSGMPLSSLHADAPLRTASVGKVLLLLGEGHRLIPATPMRPGRLARYLQPPGEVTDALVRRWLSGNVDQSMVGRAFVDHAGLDPLAHHLDTDPEPVLWNKTGTDAGVRADVGAVTRGDTIVTWAAIANWDPSTSRAREDLTTWAVLRGMALVGEFAFEAL